MYSNGNQAGLNGERMNFNRVVSAVTKAGLKVTPSESNANMFRVEGLGQYYGTFFKQGDSAVCVSTCHKNDGPDSQTDYFPQDFHSTIKSFVTWLKRDI
jgi:hypothetical protein